MKTSRLVSAGQNIGRVCRGKAVRVACVIAVTTAALSLGSGLASAAVYTGPGHAPYSSEQWGDCHLVVGAVRTYNGAAQGGVDVSCNHYWSTINAEVALWRYTRATGWRDVSLSGWWNDHNDYALSVRTGGICGASGGWVVKATVQVGGEQTTLQSPYKDYAPHC